MHLVVYQVVQLQHVHVTHGDLALEGVAGTTVEQGDLTGFRQIGQLQQGLDFALFGTIKDRCSNRQTLTQVTRKGTYVVIRQLGDVHLLGVFLAQVIDLLQEVTHLVQLALILDHAVDLLADALGREAQMHFEDLTDVHTGRYAQRVQYDVDRTAELVMGHVLDRADLGDNTLVTVTARHLVTRLDATLDCQVNLDDFQYARRQIITLDNLATLVLELLVEVGFQLDVLFGDLLQFDLLGFIFDGQFKPLGTIQLVQTIFAVTGGQQQVAGAAEDAVFQDLELFGQVLLRFLQLHLFDFFGALVFFHAIAGKDLHVNHGTVHTVRHTQGGVLHIGGLLTEDGAQQLLFRRQLGFTLGCYLADQDVAALHFGTHVDDTGLVQLGQSGFTHVRDVGSDLFRTQLGVTGDTGQFLDVDGGQAIFLYHALIHQDRVFEVVTVPRHERDAQVLAQRQFAQVGRRTVSQHVARHHRLTQHHARTLVDTGVLVGTGVLGQAVDVDAGFARQQLIFIDLDNDTGGVDVVDHAATLGHYGNTGVNGHGAFHTGTYQRLVGTQSRYGLTLHVRTHQGSVSIIVFQERDQGRCHRYDLLRAHVHVLDLVGVHKGGFTLVTARDQLVFQTAIFGGRGVGLCDHVLAFFNG
ncbi:hypothetical protein D3C76_402890 [compost metagenome]